MKVLRSLLVFSFLVSVGNSASQFERFNFEFKGCSKGSNSIKDAQVSRCSSLNLDDCIEGSFIIENTNGNKFVATHYKDQECQKEGNKIKFECSEQHGVEINNGYYKVTCFKNLDKQTQQLKSKKNQYYSFGNDSSSSNSNVNVTHSSSTKESEASSVSSNSEASYSSYDFYSDDYSDDYSEYDYDSNELAPEGSFSFGDSIYYDSFSESYYYDQENQVSQSSNGNDQQPVNYLNNNNFKMNKIVNNNNNNNNNQQNVNNNNIQEIDQNKINSENVHTQYSDSLYASSISYDSLDPDHNSLSPQDYNQKINQSIQDYRKTHASGESNTNIPSSTTIPTTTMQPTRTPTSRPTQTPTPTSTVPTQTPIDTETPALGSSASILISNLSIIIISIVLFNLLL